MIFVQLGGAVSKSQRFFPFSNQRVDFSGDFSSGFSIFGQNAKVRNRKSCDFVIFTTSTEFATRLGCPTRRSFT